MAMKKMSEDEAMEYAYKKLFNDLDNIESRTLFEEGDITPNDDVVKGAMPESKASGGVKITVEPMMKGAEESGKVTDNRRDGDDEEQEDKDRLKGIGGMSPLMAHLHGSR